MEEKWDGVYRIAGSPAPRQVPDPEHEITMRMAMSEKPVIARLTAKGWTLVEVAE
jgi:hypothetical protein